MANIHMWELVHRELGDHLVVGQQIRVLVVSRRSWSLHSGCSLSEFFFLSPSPPSSQAGLEWKSGRQRQEIWVSCASLTIGAWQLVLMVAAPWLLYSERGGEGLRLKAQARQKLMAVDACLEQVLGGNRGSGGNSV